ncbi:MAG: BON domain-containing protein [Actinomycetota bacterium]
MNKSLYAVLFILALAVAYAAPQTPGQNQRTQSTTQASQAGPAAQSISPATIPGEATNASGGAVAGSEAVNTGKVPLTENPQSTAARASDRELQGQIQQALNKEPTLVGGTVSVVVSGRFIDLSGRVGNPRQKLAATRIVESYASNRKVVNHLTIGDSSGNTTPTGETGNKAHPAGRPDLSSHPEPEKGSPPGTSARP